MSSRKYATPLRIKLRQSNSLVAYLLISHAGALLLVYLLPFIFIVKNGLSLCVLVSASVLITRTGLLVSSNAIVELIWKEDEEWILNKKDNSSESATLLGNSFYSPVISILNFKLPGKLFSKSVVLLNDNVDKTLYRHLRVRLKTTAHKLELP